MYVKPHKVDVAGSQAYHTQTMLRIAIKGVYGTVINIGHCEQCKIHYGYILNKNYQATHVLHTLPMLNILKCRVSM